MNRILLAEDEARIATFVSKGLTAEGYTVTAVRDGAAATELALTGQFDLIVLDIGLPVADGFSVLKALRDTGSTTPVIVLTARDSVTDRVDVLEGGAADYMAKPFAFAELVARVRLRLRETAPPPPEQELTAGSVVLDLRRRRAIVAGEDVELSAREFALAEILIRNRGQVMSREQLLSQVWGFDFDPASNVVDVYVGYLRRKLGADLIHTVRGLGYLIE